MNIEENIRNTVSEKDYLDCWISDPIPPFQEFIDVLIDRVGSFLPQEFSNLNVKIDSRTNGRIHVGGTFDAIGACMEIWGEIVWLPKTNIFRGKLGAREIKKSVEAPVDESTRYCLADDTNRDLNGYGASVELTPSSLVKKFGIPSEADNFKVSGIYVFEGNSGSAFRLHDYEATSLYWDKSRHPHYPSKEEFWASKEPYEFRVVGNYDASNFIKWLKKNVESKV